jgi:hypothetical protein
MFGDFIQSLSVINENFYLTGKKGNLYISDGYGGDVFRNGVQNTYNDTYPVIIKQNYINNYQIYNNEQININLNAWRNNPRLYNQNWYHTYTQTYNIQWGKHKWITTNKDEKWKDKILINTTDYRWPNYLDFKLLNKDIKNVLYISSDIKQYEKFVQKTGLNIPYIIVSTFEEICIMISSCKLFIGSLSGPLAIANAVHINRVIGLSNNADANLNIELDKIWPTNVKYNIT